VDINKTQYDQLLQGLNEVRVSQRKGGGGKMLSYLEAWEVRAHLIRIFGFGNWSWDVTSTELVFESESDGKWSVGYRVLGTLSIGGTTYSEAAVGSSTLGQRGEAHDMAIKTAESDALKRAAMNLGDQFGLSLYKNGSIKPVVQQTLDNVNS
jgi:recombination DNA repair RAD52 pathway protein